MDQRKLATEFAQLRLPRVLANNGGNLARDTDRLLRFRPSVASVHNMDQLVQDFNTALDETAGSNSSARSTTSRRKAWKRRCKSTSNLLLAGQNMSDDSSSSVDNVGLLSRDRGTSSLQFSDSDLEVGVQAGARGIPGRSRQSRHDYRGQKHHSQLGESDSFNENVSPFKEFRSAGNSKRKRKLKRMAVDESPENRKPKVALGRLPRSGVSGSSLVTKRKKVRSKSGHESTKGTWGGSRKTGGVIGVGGTTPGKRKRSAREKSVESGEVLSSGRSRTASLGEEGSHALLVPRAGHGAALEGDGMEMEEACSSSSLSSSEWEDLHSDGSPEADDEQSDWPGPEPGLSVMQLTDDEVDPEISFSQLLAGPSWNKSSGSSASRVIRSGTRRLKGRGVQGSPNLIQQAGVGQGGLHNPAFVEQVSRFIQDDLKHTLRLPVICSGDRNMILNLASMHSLSWRPEGPNILVLAKTRQTAQLDTDGGGVTRTSGASEVTRNVANTSSQLPEFAVPGIPAINRDRAHGQLKLRERKSTDMKRQRRTPPLPILTAGTSGGRQGERQHSGRQRSRHQAGSGSKSS